MGFHKRQIPDLKDLVLLREKLSNDEEFLQRVLGRRADAYVGPSDSIEYIEKIYESVKNSRKRADLLQDK
jgi:hypothetical protein